MSAAVDWDALRRKFDPTGATGRAVANRQAEAVFCGSMRSDPSQQRRALPIIEPEKHTDPAPVVTVAVAGSSTAECIKILPVLGLVAGKVNAGGAWRCWALAKSLPGAGSGWVRRADLVELLRALSIPDRKRRRWVAAAVELGLLIEGRGGVYTLISPARCAAILGAERVGKPAEISARSLVRDGWKARVWAAYLATLNGRPMSQQSKAGVTRVDERTQRNYQRQVPVTVRMNYADRGRGNSTAARGASETTGRCIFFHKRTGRNKQRLPDALHVPAFLSTPSKRGRSRKDQKALNVSLQLERGTEQVFRVFHEDRQRVKGVLRKLAHVDFRDRPGEIFEKIYTGKRATNWRPVAVGGAY